MNIGLLPDHGVILVIGIVGISEFSVRSEFKLEEFVSELSLVTHVIAKVEIVAHFGFPIGFSFWLLFNNLFTESTLCRGDIYTKL